MDALNVGVKEQRSELVAAEANRLPEAGEGRCATRDEAMADAEAWVRVRLGTARGA